MDSLELECALLSAGGQRRGDAAALALGDGGTCFIIFMEIFVYNPRERATVHLSTRYSVADGASQHCGGPGGTSHGFVGIGMHAA